MTTRPNPPASDLDWTAVDRAVRGDLPTVWLTHDEQRAAAKVLLRSGMTPRAISARVCVTERTIGRWKAEWKAAAEADKARAAAPVTETLAWQNRAACRREDPELFFPIGETGPALLQIEEAKAVCRRCPVVDWCLAWALDSGQQHGLWGGASESERRSMKRREQRARSRGAAS